MRENFTSLYGETVSTNSHAWMVACEARSLLALPLERRRAVIDQFVKKRGRGDPSIEHSVREGLQKALTQEWEWRRRDRVAA